MPYCGEKYAHRIRTIEGRTPEDPCGWYCNVPDWEHWQQAMDGLQAELNRKAADLQTKATNMGRGDVYEKVLRLYVGPGHNAVTAAQAAAPSWIDSFPGDADISAAIAKAIEAMNILACALEQVDVAYFELGMQAPETPGAVGRTVRAGEDPEWWVWARKGGIALGAGVFGYLIVRYWLDKRLLEAQQRTRPPIDARGYAA